MNKRNFLNCFATLIFVGFGGPNAAYGCSCGPTPNVLDSLERAGNVVIVKAVAIEKVNKAENPYAVDGVKSTRMIVEKVYKGKLKVGDEITFAQGGGADCIWTFNEESIGQEYLFYLVKGDKTTPIWIAGGCGRSSSLSGANEDLLYLDNLNKTRGKTRISGQLDFAGYESQPSNSSLDGISVTIIGPKTVTVKTNSKGVYEAYDLPPGIYRIIPRIPEGWKVNDFYLRYTDARQFLGDDSKKVPEYKVQLKPGRHTSVGFHLEVNSLLSGKVFSPSGVPMSGVCVNAYPADKLKERPGFLMDCTEDNGEFRITEVPPGNYVIIANENNTITSKSPFPTLYYPGVFDVEKASKINLSFGENRTDLDIFVPSVEQVVTVKGLLLFSDGKPVPDESVGFISDNGDRAGTSETTTDKVGRFELKVLKGRTGIVSGSMFTYLGEYENCPKLDALIKASGKSTLGPVTNEIRVDATEDVYDIELRFTFPSCRKAPD